jgi:hypothetical protein
MTDTEYSGGADNSALKTSLPIKKNQYVLTGLSAYSIMYHAAILAGVNCEGLIAPPADRMLGDTLEIVHINPEKCIEELNLAHVKRYRPYINLIPETVEGVSPEGKVRIDVMTGRLISTVSAQIGGSTYRLTCAQYLLRQFLARYHHSRMVGTPGAKMYLDLYNSTMKLVESGAEIARLSVATYGNENVSLSKEITLRRVFTDLGVAVADYLPSNYYPHKRAPDMPRLQYDISRNVIFAESGELIE